MLHLSARLTQVSPDQIDQHGIDQKRTAQVRVDIPIPHVPDKGLQVDKQNIPSILEISLRELWNGLIDDPDTRLICRERSRMMYRGGIQMDMI